MTPVRISTYTDFAIEIWGFNQRLTDTLRYHTGGVNVLPVCWHPLSQHVYHMGRKVEFTRSCPLFFGTKFNSSLGMEYSGELYGFSAVKVKLVDSLI